ncbi:MAG TPA: hypothetical protein VIR31_07800 [Nitrososphaeraceae archaeon]
MLNSTELQKLGYTYQEAYKIMRRLCNALPTTTITMMIQFKRFGRYEEVQRGIRHVRLDDAIQLCGERIENRCNISSVNKEFWSELKVKLLTLHK